jgi:hypothetical protein
MTNIRAQHAADEFNRFAERMAAPARCDPTLSFDTPALAQAASVWRDKAAGREMPLRRDMGARTLRPFLSNVVLLDVVEVDGTRRYLVRLMGTSIAQVLGEHTGQYLDETITSPFRERWSMAMEAALSAGVPLRLSGRVDYGGHDYLAMELMLAPIEPRAGSVAGLLVVAYARYSARHIFDPLVRNAVSSAPARKSAAR